MSLQEAVLHLLPRSRPAVLLLLGAIAAPVTVDFAPGKVPALSAAVAHARGSDDGGGRGRGGNDSGRGGDDNGGRDRGGDDGGHGRGADDGPGDDHGGRGRGGDDRGEDDHGGRGRGRGDDDGTQGADRGRHGGRKGGDNFGGKPSAGAPAGYERSARGIEVTYADGWREELENGRYELKDAQNRTVVERPATQQDYNRLGAIAR